MMIRYIGLAMVLLFAASANAQDADLAEAEALYMDQCSSCHGKISPQSARREPREALRKVALGLEQAVRTDSLMLAIAPPYGPNLTGVYGRPAGSVPGFNYSKAFKQALEGVVWDGETLDVYITNSQARVPGAFMFYRQPDPEIRRKIIAFLKANS